MATPDLRYGSGSIPFDYDDDRIQVVKTNQERRGLTDVEIGERLDSPVGSEKLEDIVTSGETALFVVQDATSP